MILNVKKSNFIIYVVCLIIGLLFIGIAVLLYVFYPNTIADEIMLSIGCSTIPTVVTAYLIDQASEKRENKRILELRNHFLWGMPHGLLWIMKQIIERYHPSVNSTNKSFYDCFIDSVEVMKSINYGYEELEQQKDDIDAILKDIDYGISLCVRDCQSIISHDYELEINKIFSKEELLAISYLLEECQRIKNSFILSDMAEYIELFVKNIIKSIPETKAKADRNVELKNKIVRNWYEISK